MDGMYGRTDVEINQDTIQQTICEIFMILGH